MALSDLPARRHREVAGAFTDRVLGTRGWDAPAVRRVAVQHRKVRETRLDAHHKLAHRIVRDNQAIYVEDLAVSGLARTRLKSSRRLVMSVGADSSPS